MIMLKIKPGMAIHCKTQEEANLLFDNTSLKFDKLFSDKWHHWDVFGENTCYSYNQYEVWSYGHYVHYKEDPNYEIIEFKDLIVKEEGLPSVEGVKNKHMLKTGILMRCERCDKEEFFEDKDERGDAEYDVMASDWKDIGGRFACPECYKQYELHMKMFWDEYKYVKED